MEHGGDAQRSALEYGFGDSVTWLWSRRVVSSLSASTYFFVSRSCQAHSAGKLTGKASLFFSWSRYLVEVGGWFIVFKLLPLKKLVLSLVVFLVHSVQTKKQLGFLSEVEKL